MPGLNRRGPRGEGSMTGRRLGHCNPDNRGKSDEEILRNRDNSVDPGQGMGRGLGQGRGAGKGQGFGRGLGARFRGNAH